MGLRLAQHLMPLAFALATACAGTTGPTVVGMGEIGTGLWVERQLPGGSAFYLCYPSRRPDVVCYPASVRWNDKPRAEIPPFEPPPPEPTPDLAPEPQPAAPPHQIPKVAWAQRYAGDAPADSFFATRPTSPRAATSRGCTTWRQLPGYHRKKQWTWWLRALPSRLRA